MPVLNRIPARGRVGFVPVISLGDTPTAGQVTAGYGTQAAAGIATGPGSIRERLVLSAPQLAGVGVGVAALLGSGAAKAAIPVVGAAIAGATIAISLWKARKGPYQKVATTQIVNEAEPILQENLKAYMEGPRTFEAQAWALQNFDDVWSQVLALCGDPKMGKPGERCISERQRGGSAPWCPTGTGCDWFVLYRDPIAQDPDVRPAPAPESPAGGLARILGGGTAPGGGQDSPSLVWPLLGVGLIAAAVML